MNIRTIFLYPGPLSVAPVIASLKPAMEKAGIYWPKEFQSSPQIFYPLHNFLPGSLLNADNAPPFSRSMEGIRADLEASGKAYSGLCFCTHLLSAFPDALKRLCDKLGAMFPGARICSLYCPCRQDIEMEAWAKFVVLQYSGFALSGFRNYQTSDLYFHDKHVQRLFSLLGRDNVEVLPFDRPEDAEQERAAILRVFGLEPDADMAPPAAPPFYYHLLPREIVNFVCLVHSMLAPDRARKLTFLPWGGQLARFMPYEGRNSLYSGFSLYGSQWRQEILTFHAQPNARLAQMLGRSELFSAPEPEPGWRGLQQLTAESIFEIVECLDRDFAASLLDRTDNIPLQYLDRLQRICRQVLRDVLMPSRAALSRHPRQRPKVSVLTLTYNHSAYIGQCIESVIAQETDFPIQHLIGDDGSDDGTQDIILDYAAKYPHIVPVFQLKRSHGPQNVYTLFDMARTEYVALCDGDDYFSDPAKLQNQADLLDAHPDYALCFHPVRVTYEGAPEKERLYPTEDMLPRGIRPFYYLVDLIRNNFIQTNAVMYRWRFKDGLPYWFPRDIMPADRYWHLLHAEMGKIGFINTVMSVYRRHEKSVFYLSEVDPLQHRAKVGMREIKVWDVINKHFNGKYESIIQDMVNHIFADCLRYDMQQGKDDLDEESLLSKLSEEYPSFARNFLRSLKL